MCSSTLWHSRVPGGQTQPKQAMLKGSGANRALEGCIPRSGIFTRRLGWSNEVEVFKSVCVSDQLANGIARSRSFACTYA